MTATTEYVYCVVPATLELTDAPGGLNATRLRTIVHADVAALVSAIDAGEFGGEAVSALIGDPEWLAPHAVAHDAVVTWAGDRGAVIPFPMWVMFSDAGAVASMLGARREEFLETLTRVSGARELCVRVLADRSSLVRAAEQLESGFAELERQAADAKPGQAYLLRSKLAAARKSTTRDVAARISERTHSALALVSRDSAGRAGAALEDHGVIMDAVYLVADDQYDAFRAALTQIVAEFEPTGIKFEFTGPWPPYHFVRAD